MVTINIMSPLLPQGITQRKERFDIATASQLGSPPLPSPTFSNVQWQSTLNTTTRPASKDCDLQLTIEPELVTPPAEDLPPNRSPHSSSPIDLQKGGYRQPTSSTCQQCHQRKLESSTSSVNQQVTKPRKTSQLTAAQIKQCSLIFARSALLREKYDFQDISYSDIPMSAVFLLLQDLKLPFDLIFRSLAICDGKIAGLPIKAHSEKFVLSSCGLEVGSCKFLNLPLNRIDRCSTTCGYGGRIDDVCGRTLISNEYVGPFKHNESREKIRRGSNWKNLWRCGDDLSFTLDFAREMIKPDRSRKFKFLGTERSEEKKGRTHLLASRIDFSDIIRRIVELEDRDIPPWRPNGKYCRQMWSITTRQRSERQRTYMEEKKAFPYLWPTGLPSALVIPFDPPITSPRRPRLYREFDFLCFIRLITEIQRHFLVVKPISQHSASSSSSSSCSSSSSSSSPRSPKSSSEAASTSHRPLLSNYQLAWLSPALASAQCNLNKPNANANANANHPKNNRDGKLFTYFAHTPSAELNDLVSHLAKDESFMTKARLGQDAQRIWVCGVPVSDGDIDCSPVGDTDANGTDAGKSMTAAEDGGREGYEYHVQQQREQRQQQLQQQQQQQQQNLQRNNKWWVLFLLNRRLARYIQY